MSPVTYTRDVVTLHDHHDHELIGLLVVHLGDEHGYDTIRTRRGPDGIVFGVEDLAPVFPAMVAVTGDGAGGLRLVPIEERDCDDPDTDCARAGSPVGTDDPGPSSAGSSPGTPVVGSGVPEFPPPTTPSGDEQAPSVEPADTVVTSAPDPAPASGPGADEDEQPGQVGSTTGLAAPDGAPEAVAPSGAPETAPGPGPDDEPPPGPPPYTLREQVLAFMPSTCTRTWGEVWGAVKDRDDATGPALNAVMAQLVDDGMLAEPTPGFFERPPLANTDVIPEPEPDDGPLGPPPVGVDNTAAITDGRRRGPAPKVSDEDLVAYLAEHGPTAASDLGAALKYSSTDSLRQRLRRMAARGLVAKHPDGWAAPDTASGPAAVPAPVSEPGPGTANVVRIHDEITEPVDQDEGRRDWLADVDLVELIATHAEGKRSNGLTAVDVRELLPWEVRSLVDGHQVAARLALLADSEQLRRGRGGRYLPLEPAS